MGRGSFSFHLRLGALTDQESLLVHQCPRGLLALVGRRTRCSLLTFLLSPDKTRPISVIHIQSGCTHWFRDGRAKGCTVIQDCVPVWPLWFQCFKCYDHFQFPILLLNIWVAAGSCDESPWEPNYKPATSKQSTHQHQPCTEPLPDGGLSVSEFLLYEFIAVTSKKPC
jgi:hypothetical protein